MDKRQAKNVKKQSHGEANYSPAPRETLDFAARSGMRIHVYFDNVTGGGCPQDRPLERRRVFEFYCISHLISGDGFYCEPGFRAVTELAPGDAVFVIPGKAMNYGVMRSHYTEDSICFSGPRADALRDAGVFRPGVLNIGRERRLFPIIRKIREGTVTAMIEANTMLETMLFNIHRERLARREARRAVSLGSLMSEVSATPGHWWTVKEMAEYCGVSRNYLREMFKTGVGMHPKEYIDRVKTGRAAEMLCGTDMKVGEIAAALGFKDPFHFIKRFKTLTGMTPSRHRARFGKKF
jgi:AraC-like DNA-binding protein